MSKYNIPGPPEPGMKRIGTMTPEQIASILDVMPEELTPGDVSEIVLNILFNYNMLDDALGIAAQIVMASRQQGIVSTEAVIIDGGDVQ